MPRDVVRVLVTRRHAAPPQLASRVWLRGEPPQAGGC